MTAPRWVSEMTAWTASSTRSWLRVPSMLAMKPVPQASRGAVRFSFADLCEAPLAAADYLEIARQFHTVVLDGVPRTGPAQHNEARRFMTLIDVLYDHRVNLVASAADQPEALYSDGTGAREFQRTASRLAEMRSHDYIVLPHAPG